MEWTFRHVVSREIFSPGRHNEISSLLEKRRQRLLPGNEHLVFLFDSLATCSVERPI